MSNTYLKVLSIEELHYRQERMKDIKNENLKEHNTT